MALATDAPPALHYPTATHLPTAGIRPGVRYSTASRRPTVPVPGCIRTQWHEIPSCRHRADGHVHRPVIIGTPRKARAMRRLRTIGVIVVVGLLAAACGSSGGKPSSSSGSGKTTASGTLTIDNESGGTWTCQFNPFNLSYISYS